jgi:hypothetical protein
MSQATQILGAVAILVAYALAQFKVLDQRTYPYNLLNLFGAIALGVIAYAERLWGFFLLEVAWGLVALWGLGDRVRTKA